MKIGIVSTSMRQGSASDQIATWIHHHAKSRHDDDVIYEFIELEHYDLPLFGKQQSDKQREDIQAWKDKFEAMDGYIFITAEYNRVIPGFFKNALDYLMKELHDKAVGYVGFGGLGGLSAIQSLRLINAEQGLASVKTMVTFSINVDFNEEKSFDPKPYHIKEVDNMMNEVLSWSKGLKSIR